MRRFRIANDQDTPAADTLLGEHGIRAHGGIEGQ
jgi:hypothetical protein